MALVVKDTGSTPTHKVCKTCKDSKPLSEFHVHSTHKYGKNNECKVCKNEFKRSWYNKK